MTRAIVRSAGALALAGLAAVLVAAPAQAAAYRYWTYWQGSGDAWTFATVGPASAVPADGAVEGWSFRVSTDVADPAAAPAPAPDFATICAGTAAQPDRKRVALVVDSGPSGIAPDGQVPPAPVATCVVADPDASGYEILRSVAEVRVEDGLVCGIAGYPTGECAPVLDDVDAAALLAASTAPPVSAPAASPSAAEPSTSSPVATIVVAVALLGGAAAWAWSRRRAGR